MLAIRALAHGERFLRGWWSCESFLAEAKGYAHFVCPSDVVIVALGGTGLEYKALCLVGEERSVGVEWGA